MQTTNIHTGSRGADSVKLRPLLATDRDRLADAFSHLSEETRRRRFAGPAGQVLGWIARVGGVPAARSGLRDEQVYAIALDQYAEERRAA